MQAEQASNLKNHFLVAMPGMADPNFHGSVIYIADHTEKGALGLLINRPMTDLDLSALFERIELSLDGVALATDPVFYGGPVQTDRGFVLHRPAGNWSSSLQVAQDVALTSSKDVLEAVAAGTGPEQLMVMLGYSGWGPGQLEDEIARNAWLTAPADAGLLFDVPVSERLARAFGLLGIDPAFLSSEAGHA